MVHNDVLSSRKRTAPSRSKNDTVSFVVSVILVSILFMTMITTPTATVGSSVLVAAFSSSSSSLSSSASSRVSSSSSVQSHYPLSSLIIGSSSSSSSGRTRSKISPIRTTTTRLYGVRSTFQRVVRGAVRTLVREPKKKESEQEEEPPQKMYRLIYYDQCDYQPENVARILAKIIPSLDRRVAYELTSRARMMDGTTQGVTLLITTQKECELYGALLIQYGLTIQVVQA